MIAIAATVRYSEPEVSSGAVAASASRLAPTADGTGPDLVSIPARATISAAPATAANQTAPRIRVKLTKDAAITAAAAAPVSRRFIADAPPLRWPRHRGPDPAAAR